MVVLNSLEIDHILSRVTPAYSGTYSCDELESAPLESICVVNTDKSGSTGKHWCAVLLSKNEVGEFWDSFGFPPSNYHIRWHEHLLNVCGEYRYNAVKLQEDSEQNCSAHVVAYVYYRSLGFTMDQVADVIKSRGVDQLLQDLVQEFSR